MSIWGKVLAGAAGFALGGPLGALLGLAAGHAVDRLTSDRTAADADNGTSNGGTGHRGAGDGTQSILFTIGVIVLSAKMAKADGVVKRIEVETFKRLFQVAPDELPNVGRVFDLARKDSAGFDVYARQLAGLFGERHGVLEELLDSLFLIAEADDELHDEEIEFLGQVARIFGFSDAEFARILASRPLGGSRAAAAGDDTADPWQVLGVAKGVDAETVKTAYRRLLREHHPDLLMAQGLPAEFVTLATEKTARINAAYARIKALQATAD